ncbi:MULTISPECIES: hypothetical protein [Pseudomonas]|uniref:Uncharacterized protein n=1 Tax=Pseudomonas frederiksbergensis TaxID=104087 RepID=A0A2S8HV31_9PSED|nr:MULTISPECIES: hypothetical protein [Pseudomonas]PQP06299.1 hypothetical protein C5612_00605 [Pseudomonas frederiksbergensis]WLG46752.1 hypothetical protein PSH69_09095 [Pseudomonas sp. FP1740]
MKPIEILINNHGVVETATIECDRKKPTLRFTMRSGLTKVYTAYDLYVCFGMLRADYPEIKFLCKGAKLNVHPSRMSSQMSSGLVAYELKLGKPSEDEDLVRIFDYEDENITSNIEEQNTFYQNWIESLTIITPNKT